MKYLILFVFLYSCSAEYHLKKAIKKGYKCEETGDTIRITTIDSIPYIVNDTIRWEKIITSKDTVIRYKKVYVPKTKWQVKTELKFKRDTIRIKEKTKQAEAKAEAKSKKRPNLNFLFIGIFVGFALSYLLRRVDSKINL
jgi:RNA-splicing ligase RtcB